MWLSSAFLCSLFYYKEVFTWSVWCHPCILCLLFCFWILLFKIAHQYGADVLCRVPSLRDCDTWRKCMCQVSCFQARLIILTVDHELRAQSTFLKEWSHWTCLSGDNNIQGFAKIALMTERSVDWAGTALTIIGQAAGLTALKGHGLCHTLDHHSDSVMDYACFPYLAITINDQLNVVCLANSGAEVT